MQIFIDGKRCGANQGETILAAARRHGIDIPTLCNHEALEPIGACRLCTVEITHASWKGWKGLVASCLYPVEEGLEVFTASAPVVELRQVILDLLLARCPESPEIRALAASHGLHQTTLPLFVEADNCILCGLCVRICDAQDYHALSTVNRGTTKEVGTAWKEPPADCVGCLSCARICPTGVIRYEEDQATRTIWGRKFELVRCTGCGRPLTTREHIEASRKRTGLKDEYYTCCDACKKKAVSDRFVQVGR